MRPDVNACRRGSWICRSIRGVLRIAARAPTQAKDAIQANLLAHTSANSQRLFRTSARLVRLDAVRQRHLTGFAR